MDATAPAAPTTDSNQQVTQSDGDGRTLSGIGTTSEKLAEVMERHAPVEEPAPATTPGEAPPVKPTRGQQRFAELTRARKQAEEKAVTLERELNELRGRTGAPAQAALPSASEPPTPPQAAQFVQPAPSQGRPQPSEDDIGTKYKTYADFVVDSARWVAEQEASNIDARIRSSIEADRATRDFLAHAESTWAKGRKVYSDFDTVRTTGPGAQVPMDHAKIRTILHHPQTEHMQYVIAKDAALATRLAQMGDIEFGMAMASFAPPGAAGNLASTAPNGNSTPPAPVQPVGSSSPTTVVPSANYAHQGNYPAYKMQRERERGGSRR